MGRFRDTRTGVVIDVDDDYAATLSAAYEAVEGEKKAPAKKATAPKSDTK